jgi:peptidoglycan/xylan/chitin deacetylase (PgdA/CDA1 family)
MTFDDGRQTAYDPGYTYMTSQGLAGTAYIVPTLIGRPGFMTLSELEKMNASGWDIANHTYDHVDLANLTQAQVERQLVETRDWLVSNGFPRAATDVAYPTGAYDAGVLAAMSATAMRSGRTTTGADNSVPLSNPYQIGCYFPTTLAQARADVDKAVDRQTLVVLGFHQLVASPDPTNTTQFAVSDFRTLIGYIRSRPVTVVPLSEITIGDHNNPQSTAVTAVPSVGYHFVAWSDGVISATRTDTDINADKSVTAIFGVNRN